MSKYVKLDDVKSILHNEVTMKAWTQKGEDIMNAINQLPTLDIDEVVKEIDKEIINIQPYSMKYILDYQTGLEKAREIIKRDVEGK